MSPYKLDLRMKELVGKLLEKETKEDWVEYEHLMAEKRRRLLHTGGRS